MVVEFKEMPGHSRVWIHQADKKLTKEEQDHILNESRLFLHHWAAHGKGLRSAAKIADDHFLIIALDQQHAMASGCSIDAQVRFVSGLGEKLKVNFFDRLKVAYLEEGEVKLISLSELKKTGKSTIDSKTIVYNNMIASKEELDSKWKVRAEDSWLARHLKSSMST